MHHRHIRPVQSRGWAPMVDGITVTIWARRTTLLPGATTSPGFAEP